MTKSWNNLAKLLLLLLIFIYLFWRAKKMLNCGMNDKSSLLFKSKLSKTIRHMLDEIFPTQYVHRKLRVGFLTECCSGSAMQWIVRRSYIFIYCVFSFNFTKECKEILCFYLFDISFFTLFSSVQTHFDLVCWQNRHRPHNLGEKEN